MAQSVPCKEFEINESLEKLKDFSLLWLADASLFINAEHIERFYDAVVRPDGETGTTTLTITEGNAKEISGKLGGGIEASPGVLTSILTALFSLKVKTSAEVGGKGEWTQGQTDSIVLHPIRTPQRQLVHLAAHYLVNLRHRLFFANEDGWRDKPEVVSSSPRAMVFLDLPGEKDAERLKAPLTKLIPMAAEFADGAVTRLFESLSRENGLRPGKWPDRREEKETLDDLLRRRMEYWKFFDEEFNSTQAMSIIEDAGTQHGRIRWIDFRLPLLPDWSQTLHLHCCPSEQFDTGVFAYNFVRRGYQQGLRLVGTLRSEPSMNVLAIFEK